MFISTYERKYCQKAVYKTIMPTVMKNNDRFILSGFSVNELATDLWNLIMGLISKIHLARLLAHAYKVVQIRSLFLY
jgi:hypothetical protein